MEEKKKPYICVCSTLFPISNMLLKESGIVDHNHANEQDYTDCFYFGVSDPRAFFKERLSEEDYKKYLRGREYNLIKDDFEDLDFESYMTDEEYREATLNILFDEKVNTLKNL